LGTGDIYEIRGRILEEIENSPDGEELYQKLIRILQRIERTNETKKRGALPEYEHFPKTLAEGKKYFLSEKQNG
jgi:hypothetical protein